MINYRYQQDIKNLIQKLKNVSLLVNNYDEAIAFYTQKLGFKVTMDVPYGERKMNRWITLGLPNENEKEGAEISLVLSNSEQTKNMVGKQASNYPLLVLLTDNCQQEYERMKSGGVKFLGQPQQTPYGIEVVFEDLYGNIIYLRDKNTDRANISLSISNEAERIQINRNDGIKNNLEQELQNEEREQEQLKIDPEQVLEEEEKIQPKSTTQE